MINTIIFDIGKVLVEADWHKTLDLMNIAKEHQDEIIKATVEGPKWDGYDHGDYTFDEMLNDSISLAPEREAEIRYFYSRLDIIVQTFDYAADWLKYYRDKGFKVYILSNFPKEPFEACEDQFEFLKYIEGAVVSYRWKESKPDRAIYDRLIRMYEIIPENAIFVDDRVVNVDAARRLGFNGVVFKDRESADREILSICEERL